MISALGQRLKDWAATVVFAIPSYNLTKCHLVQVLDSAGFADGTDYLSLINSLTHGRGIRLFVWEKDVSVLQTTDYVDSHYVRAGSKVLRSKLSSRVVLENTGTAVQWEGEFKCGPRPGTSRGIAETPPPIRTCRLGHVLRSGAHSRSPAGVAPELPPLKAPRAGAVSEDSFQPLRTLICKRLFSN